MRALLISGCMLSFFVATAQVQSGAYSVILKTLLSHSVPEVSVTELKETKNIVFFDAREKDEYQVSHISNAKYVGYNDFDLKKLDQYGKNEKIIVYCSVGYRSEKIAEKLINAGFSDVSNLYGGIFEWVNEGRPIVDNANQSTENIHPYSKTWGIWLTKGNKVYEAK
jgi:rhodanese-related sulfurtransferase